MRTDDEYAEALKLFEEIEVDLKESAGQKARILRNLQLKIAALKASK